LEDIEKRIDFKAAKYEELLARNIIGGKSFAGAVVKTAAELAAEENEKQVKNAMSKYYK
jgi:hypothetical protein